MRLPCVEFSYDTPDGGRMAETCVVCVLNGARKAVCRTFSLSLLVPARWIVFNLGKSVDFIKSVSVRLSGAVLKCTWRHKLFTVGIHTSAAEHAVERARCVTGCLRSGVPCERCVTACLTGYPRYATRLNVTLRFLLVED
jgi:hypothetical protein